MREVFIMLKMLDLDIFVIISLTKTDKNVVLYLKECVVIWIKKN